MDKLEIPGLSEEPFARLDKIEIRGLKSIEARFALGVELFIAPPAETDKFQVDRKLLNCVEQYFTHFKEHINRYVLPDALRVGKVKRDPFPKWEAALEKQNEEDSFCISAYHDDTQYEGEPVDATPWQIHMLGPRPSKSRLSHIRASMSVCNARGNNNFKALLDMTFAWCEELKPAHGSAGFSFAYDPEIEPKPKWTWAAMQRYPGVDHHDPVMFTVKAKTVFNRIKGVNWLTVLGDEIVNELGGKDVIQTQLGKFCAIHNYDGGIIIIAGLLPQLGDTYTGLIPERYKDVARVTRPVRFEDYRRPFLQLPESIDGMEATLKWIRRFDE